MPMKPPRPLASSPTSSGMWSNLITSQPEISGWQKVFFWVTCIYRTQSGGWSCLSWHRDKKLTTSFEPSLLPPRFSQQKWTTCDQIKLGSGLDQKEPDRAEWHTASHLAQLQPTRLEDGKEMWKKKRNTHQKGLGQSILIVGNILDLWTGIDPIDGRVAERLFPKISVRFYST